MNASSRGALAARGAWFVVVAGLFTACGGIAAGPVENSNPDGGTSDGGTSDASTQDGGPTPIPLSTSCPASAPTVGTACGAPEGTDCEYGNAWWSVACDVVVECTGGQWQTAQISYTPCTAEPGPNAATCPSTYASVPTGATCDATNGLSCYYPEGSCTCADSLGGPESPNAYWNCLPGDGCPYPRPPLGSACSGTTSCTYEECAYAQNCQNGTWQGSPEACASAQGD